MARPGNDEKVPTVDEALTAIDDWVAEQKRVTGMLRAEIAQAKGPSDGAPDTSRT